MQTNVFYGGPMLGFAALCANLRFYCICQPESAYQDDLLDALPRFGIHRIFQPLCKRAQDAVPVMTLYCDDERETELPAVAPVQILHAFEFLDIALVKAGTLLLACRFIGQLAPHRSLAG